MHTARTSPELGTSYFCDVMAQANNSAFLGRGGVEGDEVANYELVELVNGIQLVHVFVVQV